MCLTKTPLSCWITCVILKNLKSFFTGRHLFGISPGNLSRHCLGIRQGLKITDILFPLQAFSEEKMSGNVVWEYGTQKYVWREIFSEVIERSFRVQNVFLKAFDSMNKDILWKVLCKGGLKLKKKFILLETMNKWKPVSEWEGDFRLRLGVKQG